MLSFRLMVGAILLGSAYVAVVVSSMGENVSLWRLGPRPALAIASVPGKPLPPPEVQGTAFVPPEPIAPPARAARPGREVAGIAEQPSAQERSRARPAQTGSSDIPFNPLRLFFPLAVRCRGKAEIPPRSAVNRAAKRLA
jgi:hypothetical protein